MTPEILSTIRFYDGNAIKYMGDIDSENAGC